MTETPPGKGSPFEFFNEVGIIGQLGTARFQKVLPDGMHPSHFGVLNHMVRLGDAKTPAQLASAFQVTRATMSHTLALLEKRGLIRLAANERDARSKLVYLTDEGRAFRNAAIGAVEAMVGDVFDDAMLDHLAKALPHLRAIRKRLDENR
ncbi:MAG: MarR family transcriptional regulator [Roseitalea sp.]|nr:MarR family transcriptional regulator [Roseitalea sp.]MBO6952998.1 MarR family transcriptional regulator [Rhizobiaceae bacterium]MBO6593345.1 MarR family transcriptional regulator [Roseitalea sp.]MBO6600665.1 MarR family transcriptional regulator [Roseitalea sp.]MBO6612346.1 MarR family transcriptional regulator [Roseitalea sp.]